MELKLALICMFLSINDEQMATPKRILSYAGPFQTYMEKCYQCAENKPSDKFRAYIRPSRFSGPTGLQKLTGNCTFKVSLDDSISDELCLQFIKPTTVQMLAKMDLWNNNQWKENAFILKFPNACSGLRSNVPDVFEKIFKQNAYTKATCSIAAGCYSYVDQPVNFTFPNIPVLPYGTYRLKLSLTKEKDFYGCSTVEAKIQPRA